MENRVETKENLLVLDDDSSIDGNRLTLDIVDNLLSKEPICYSYDDSGSTEFSQGYFYTKENPTRVDRRLLYWKNMIHQRRAMQRRLCLATAKKPQELLLNADCREYKTIQRILDRAEQEHQSSREPMELVGVPREVNRELLDVVTKRNVIKRKWLESQDFWQNISSRFPQIKNILEFCPDFDELEVIGKALLVHCKCNMETLYSISTLDSQDSLRLTLDMPITSAPIRLSNPEEKPSVLKLAVLINGTTYQVGKPEFSPILERRFVCNPYEYSYRVIMRIENNGLQTLSFKWKRSEFFAYNDSLFNTDRAAFVFDTEPFQLVSGAFREVSVLFRPRKVGIIKQRWLLTTSPRIFMGFPSALTLNMHGRCKPPQEYLEAIEAHVTLSEQPVHPLHKKSTTQESGLNEPITPCPYIRQLSSIEAFNQRNVGFHCERKSDIIDLRKFFELVKPSESLLQWNYSVSMLIDLVCIQDDVRQRSELFKDLQILLAKLRGRSDQHRLACGDNPENIEQRNRTRFIFVHGIMSNCVEVWEQKIWLLTSKMLRVEQVQSSSRENTFKQMYSKSFRDSLYIYTYNHLCDVVEDVVSVIESTEHVYI